MVCKLCENHLFSFSLYFCCVFLNNKNPQNEHIHPCLRLEAAAIDLSFGNSPFSIFADLESAHEFQPSYFLPDYRYCLEWHCDSSFRSLLKFQIHATPLPWRIIDVVLSKALFFFFFVQNYPGKHYRSHMFLFGTTFPFFGVSETEHRWALVGSVSYSRGSLAVLRGCWDTFCVLPTSPTSV